MAKPVRTLPIASALGERQLKIFQTDWSRIENAYGQKIPRCTRVEILKLTRACIRSARFEFAAEPLNHARRLALLWKRGAAKLQQGLIKDNGSDAHLWAQSKVKRHFSDNRVRQMHLWDDLLSVSSTFIAACEKAIADMDDPELPGFSKGERWQAWVGSLVRVLDQAGLPTGARKDSSDLGKESSFTNLVHEMQAFMPAEIQRAGASRGALAKAIQRARQVTSEDK